MKESGLKSMNYLKITGKHILNFIEAINRNFAAFYKKTGKGHLLTYILLISFLF